jgi:peptide/nickel transport system permease protein
VLITVLGLAAGITGALTAGRAADRALLVLVTVLAAVPSFVAAILLISVFSVRLGWFPSFGAGEGLVDDVYHLALPAVALSLTFIALVGRVTREAMLEELGREHVEVALSRGLPRRTVVRRHVLRNALGPISTITGLLIAGLLVSSAIVESAFGLSGLGSLLVQSVDKGDFPVVQAIVLIVVSTFVVANLVVDLLQPLIDPRTLAGTAAR